MVALDLERTVLLGLGEQLLFALLWHKTHAAVSSHYE